MAIDWSVVALDHVRQACREFAANATATRGPRPSWYVSLDGERYPAKVIRGMAYRIATGIDLRPDQYAGGNDTGRFFARLGLATDSSPSAQLQTPQATPATPSLTTDADESEARAASPPVPATAVPTAVVQRSANTLSPRAQKLALRALLEQQLGPILVEATFPWLKVPDLTGPGNTIATIHAALQALRGHSGFAAVGRMLRCDFVAPDSRLIVEYDERQHFTAARAVALALYPSELHLAYDREVWTKRCEAINAHDPSPPFRDEQRAYFDSVRDLLAAEHGYTVLRLSHGAIDWTAADAAKTLAAILNPLKQAVPVTSKERICRIALVSHNYTRPSASGRWDYSDDLAAINRRCDEEGCDTILYALFTWDTHAAGAIDHSRLFAGLTHVRRIVLETCENFGGKPWESQTPKTVEVWRRDDPTPMQVFQRFARGNEAAGKQKFMAELVNRVVDDGLLIVCGESNIVTLRGSQRNVTEDTFGFLTSLGDLNPFVILNPIHDYMRRHEMKKKRQLYSRGGRAVISVWNLGNRAKPGEAHTPWTVYFNGNERSDAVREITAPECRADVRIGVLDLLSL